MGRFGVLVTGDVDSGAYGRSYFVNIRSVYMR